MSMRTYAVAYVDVNQTAMPMNINLHKGRLTSSLQHPLTFSVRRLEMPPKPLGTPYTTNKKTELDKPMGVIVDFQKGKP